MSFIIYRPGDKAKIINPKSRYYNRDYYDVIAQHPQSGNVVVRTPDGPQVYSASSLKKWVEPPPGSIPAPEPQDEKEAEAKRQADFFARSNSDNRVRKCPLCGKGGRPLFNGFICSNRSCANG